MEKKYIQFEIPKSYELPEILTEEAINKSVNLNILEFSRTKKVYENEYGKIEIYNKGKETEIVRINGNIEPNKSKIEKILGIKIEEVKN
jgi:hypothetical protein